MSFIDGQNALLERYGFVRRAKECYLYTEKNTRLIDMCQEGGKAVLGWRFGSAQRDLKNALERGVVGSFSSIYEGRLKAVLHKLFPDFSFVYILSDCDRDAVEAFCGKENGTSLFLWRPWFASVTEEGHPLDVDVQTMEVTIPFPFANDIMIIVSKKQLEICTTIFSKHSAPPFLAALVRAFYDLIKELPKRTEKEFARYDAYLLAFWNRCGAYLYPKSSLFDEKSYSDFFYRCLDRGFYISPVYAVPSVIPYAADEGAICKIVN